MTVAVFDAHVLALSKRVERPSKGLSAFGLALALETTLIVGAVYWAVASPPKPIEKVIPITIENITPEPETLPEPEKPKPLPPPIKQIQLPPPQAKIIQPQPVQQLPTVKEPQAVVQATTPTPAIQNTNQAPAPTSTAAPPPVPVATSQDILLAYQSKVRAAAQAALEVPGTVSALGFKGRTRVGFNLRDGVASNVTVIQSSGLGAMDRAATKAVQSASYPAPPALFQAKDIAYEIWVTHAPAN